MKLRKWVCKKWKQGGSHEPKPYNHHHHHHQNVSNKVWDLVQNSLLSSLGEGAEEEEELLSFIILSLSSPSCSHNFFAHSSLQSPSSSLILCHNVKTILTPCNFVNVFSKTFLPPCTQQIPSLLPSNCTKTVDFWHNCDSTECPPCFWASFQSLSSLFFQWYPQSKDILINLSMKC